MKKCILLCFIILNTISSYTQPVPPVRVADCPAITTVPVIDGLMDEPDWSPEQDMTLFIVKNDDDWQGKADFTSVFHIMWGWSYFYTFVEITDDIEQDWDEQNGNAFEFDNVEWYFQLDTQTVPTTYTDNTTQMRFNRGDLAWQSSIFRTNQTADNFIWYWENTTDGWIIEAAIPWTNVMPDGALPDDIRDWIEAGGTIGFDLSCADADGTDPLPGAAAPTTLTAWDADGDVDDLTDDTEVKAWNNTSVFGYLTLVGDPVLETNDPIIEDDKPICYPNPAGELLYFPNNKNYSQIKIYSMEGIPVLSQKTGSLSVDISFLKPGLYIAVFDNTDAVKFIKE